MCVYICAKSDWLKHSKGVRMRTSANRQTERRLRPSGSCSIPLLLEQLFPQLKVFD